jgi:hypothetical protein
MPLRDEHITLDHPYDHFRLAKIAVKPDTCFVLMPYRGQFELVYQTIVSALEGLMTCTRADDMRTGGSILARIQDGIGSAELIVADLTGQSANVFYEVGIAHSRTKNVLLLTQNIEDVPFNLRGFFCRPYSLNSTQDIERLKKAVRDAAAEVRAKRLPTMLEGPTERTRGIVEYMERELESPFPGKDLEIRIQAGFSSITNLDPEPGESISEYETLLQRERDHLIELLEKGATLRTILRRPSLGPSSTGRSRRRYERLLAFLHERQNLSDRYEFVYAVDEGSNLLFFGSEVLFEGYKTDVESGFGWTMVYTDPDYVRTRLRMFDRLFGAAREHTLKKFGDEGATDNEALRMAMIRALDRALGNEEKPTA